MSALQKELFKKHTQSELDREITETEEESKKSQEDVEEEKNDVLPELNEG